MGFFGFLFGLGAAVVVVMLMLGIMFVPGCDECKKEIVPSQSSAAQSVGSEQELWRVIKEERLKHFPSRKTINLISAAWSDRGARLETLGLFGPSGKDGVDGRPGKPGLVNMSLCVYRAQYGVPLIF